jgi:ankyrin repeat protein
MTAPNITPTPQQLSRAIFSRNRRLLEQLLDAGGDVNAAGDEFGRPLLIQAIVEGRDDCARLLIARGAALGMVGSGGQPLTMAARFGNEGICSALLDAGAPINGCDGSGKTALYEAITDQRRTICRLLVERGADVHEESRDGWLPLNAAMKPGAPAEEIVRILVAAGADPSRVPSRALTGEKVPLSAFQAAVERGHIHHVEYLMAACGEDPGQTTVDGRTMLDLAMTPAVAQLLRSAITERAISSGITASLATQQPVSHPKGLSPI